MADIELVIKISEEKLSIIKNKMYCGIYDPDLYKAIENGTPLPKGHGRLVDAKEVYKKFYCRCLAGVAYEVLNETSTIIPEDKEKEE